MKTTLLVVGKTDEDFLESGIKKYTQRIVHYWPFDFVVLPDIKNSKNMSAAVQKEKEGEMILKQIGSQDYVALLDEHGIERTSMQMAQWMGGIQSKGIKNLVFVIGGPYGFSDAVYKRANEKISLSKLTFPHQLVRLLFVEQLYRCHTILKGEPYHHE
ncbi:MAG: 23S rRNA (pseudouridine(1915)-N(3))-methyltransferase RlmH [Salinivirgaceae bacterium]|nr:23S rRNA (pseudouridine(1915)-N(3))-methyltransferase RlmH [Salinivirgaceae bacterium]